MSRIFVTGDIHGWLGSRWKLDEGHFPVGHAELGKDDYVIVAGDMAALFNCDPHDPLGDGRCSERERQFRDWVEALPWTTLFVDGNHENHDALASLPTEEWNGGTVHRISPSLIHLTRGQVFDFAIGTPPETQAISVFTMGGARSVDRARRTEGIDWWAGELPTYDEIDAAEAILEAHGWGVDYVITHASSPEVSAMATGNWGMARETDRLTNWLGYVRDRLSYKRWFSGHLHVDADVGEGGRDSVLFDRVVEIVP